MLQRTLYRRPVVGSGSSTHNLRLFGRPKVRDPAAAFDTWLQRTLADASPNARVQAAASWSNAAAVHRCRSVVAGRTCASDSHDPGRSEKLHRGTGNRFRRREPLPFHGVCHACARSGVLRAGRPCSLASWSISVPTAVFTGLLSARHRRRWASSKSHEPVVPSRNPPAPHHLVPEAPNTLLGSVTSNSRDRDIATGVHQLPEMFDGGRVRR